MKYKIYGSIVHEFSVEVEADGPGAARNMAEKCARMGIGQGAVKDGPVRKVHIEEIDESNKWKNQSDGAS